jgi:hypothetical protein
MTGCLIRCATRITEQDLNDLSHTVRIADFYHDPDSSRLCRRREEVFKTQALIGAILRAGGIYAWC